MGAAGHAVAAPGVGKPEVLGRDAQEGGISLEPLAKGGEAELQARTQETVIPGEFWKGPVPPIRGFTR